jgi:outer membrane lipoprotein-sorting protein
VTLRGIMCAVLVIAHGVFAGAPPASRPANIEPGLWARMLEVDAKAGEVFDLTASFEQRKITAMLKKPLISSGRIHVRGPVMLWKTEKPEPSVVRISEREISIYYPTQNTIEVYPVAEKLGSLVASPLPRLSVLLEHFTFEPLALSELGESDATRFLAFRMRPGNPELARHIEQVRVLLDAASGLIVRLELCDSDGDRTLISFSQAQTNTGLRETDVQIAAPPDVKVTRPLRGLEDTSQKGDRT